MNSITMKLTDMVRPEKNVRIHTEQQLREFERSVKMFGQIRPIVVDEKNVILAGNGLYETLLSMGYEEALVYQYTDLTENQKKKLMIADNKIFSLGIENLELLTQSIFTNGWTLPIVVRPDYTIIDGFHRWTVAGPEWKYVPPSEKDKRTLFERLGGKVLVVIVDHKDKAGNIYGTVTHNRARGTHLLEPMKKIVKELMEEGKSVEEIGKQLGMRPEEIFRLSEFSKEDFLKMMVQEKKNFSKAEYITKI